MPKTTCSWLSRLCECVPKNTSGNQITVIKWTHFIREGQFFPARYCSLFLFLSYLLPGNKFDTASSCSSWLAAQRATASSAISQKWGMQLKWQVAASSRYDSRAATRRCHERWRIPPLRSICLLRGWAALLDDLTVFIPKWGCDFLVIQSASRLKSLNWRGGGF